MIIWSKQGCINFLIADNFYIFIIIVAEKNIKAYYMTTARSKMYYLYNRALVSECNSTSTIWEKVTIIKIIVAPLVSKSYQGPCYIMLGILPNQIVYFDYTYQKTKYSLPIGSILLYIITKSKRIWHFYWCWMSTVDNKCRLVWHSY